MRDEETLVQIPAEGVTLEGDLTSPPGAPAIVLFVHGSGSSRRSPRNRAVAATLREGGLATLLIDLLTADEEDIDSATGELRFDIRFLARRVVAVTDWLTFNESTRALRIGYIGASTGAAAALVAAAGLANAIAAVVSRGGRPDLAAESLPEVAAPTLLIVGGHDRPVIRMNQEALAALRCERRLEIVSGATHLFEEPGALAAAADLARSWFTRHLAAPEVRLPAGEPGHAQP